MRPTTDAHNIRTERAAAVAVAVSMLAMFGLAVAVTAVAGRAAADQARVQAAADATALALAGGGSAASGAVAEANGVAIERLSTRGPCGRVTVSAGPIQASATALWELVWMPPERAPDGHRLTCRGF
ncbi:MAG: hypothetical protein HKN26_10730 [Acidimicrobiales bacterium]|nr:hypothetical protein [Acidimicrobiales bacterium]